MGSKLGVMKIAAKRVGLTLEQYESRVRNGDRWCCGCKAWHDASKFTTDLSRGDGLSMTCRDWRNKNIAKTKEPIDKRRARRVVQMRVRRGKLLHPSLVPCASCGRMPAESGLRHEYHHHNGYDKDHQADVVAMCSRCHSKEPK